MVNTENTSRRREENAPRSGRQAKNEAKQNKRRRKSVNLVVPDGGWGWIVVIGGFVTMVLIALPLVGFSLLFSPIIMRPGVSSATVAWIFNVHGFIWNAMALLVGPLIEEFGWRKVSITGGFLNFLSLGISAFVPNASFLFFSYSVLGGIGGGIGAASSIFAVSSYFEKRRGFALGIMTLGLCFGSIISPLLGTYLLEVYSYKGATLIYTAILLNQPVCGMLFQPVEWHMKPKENDVANMEESTEVMMKDFQPELQAKRLRNLQTRKMSIISMGSTGQSNLDFSPTFNSNTFTIDINEDKPTVPWYKRVLNSTYQSLVTLKYFQVIIISIASGGMFLAYVNFQMWIPFAVTDKGHSLQMAAWCVSSASIANVFGRTTMALLSDRPMFRVKYGYMFGLLCIGTCIVGFIFVMDIKYIFIFICCWGFGVGSTMSLHPLVMIERMGADLFPAVFGVASLSIGFFIVIFGPIVGQIRDATGSYTYALMLIACLDIFGLCLWIIMPLAKARDKKLESENEVMSMEEAL